MPLEWKMNLPYLIKDKCYLETYVSSAKQQKWNTIPCKTKIRIYMKNNYDEILTEKNQ
jgi:hypothetical protein